MPSLDPSLGSIYFFCLRGRLWMAKLTRAAGMKVPVVPFERKWSHSATVRKLHQAQMQREDVHDFSVQNSLLIFTSSDRRLNFVLLLTRRAGGSSWPYSYCHIITTFCLLTGWPGGKRFEGVFLEWDMSRSLRASWVHTNIPRVCWKKLIKGMLLSTCISWHLCVSIILTSNVSELSKWCC